MNNHQIRAITAGFVAALVLTALLLLVKCTALTLTAYLFALLGVIEFFGTLVYVAGSNRHSYLTNAAFPLAVKSYSLCSIFFSVVMAAADQLEIWTMPVGWFTFVQILMAAFLIWRLLAMRSGQEEIERVEQQVAASTFTWKSLRMDAEAILLRADETTRKDISAVCDAFRYADPVELPALAPLEAAVGENLSRLSQLVETGNTKQITVYCTTLRQQIKERNMRAKMLK